MSESISKPAPKYLAVVGIDDAEGNRYEPGDRVPAKLVKSNLWLLENGKVEEA